MTRSGQPEDSGSRGNWIAVGGPIDRCRVFLRISSEGLEPAAVTTRLGIAPTHAHRAGERTSASQAYPHKIGAWFYEIEESRQQPEAALRELLDLLPGDAQFWQELRHDFSVYIGLSLTIEDWNRGFLLPAELQSQLASTGADLGFELWYEPPDTP